VGEWLSDEGRKAAEMLGPIEWTRDMHLYTVTLDASGWFHDCLSPAYPDSSHWGYPHSLIPQVGNAIQNDHARKKLAEEDVYLIPNRLRHNGTVVWQYVHDGRTSRAYPYEGCLIAATLAVYGVKK